MNSKLSILNWLKPIKNGELNMLISEIDFGTKDARHAYTEGHDDESTFQRVFIQPFGTDNSDFFEGKKCFVYGIKGSGKSAYIRHLEIILRKSAYTQFIYFSDTVRNEKSLNGLAVGDPQYLNNPDDYWKAFFSIVIANVLFEKERQNAKKYLSFIKHQIIPDKKGLIHTLLSKSPTLERFSLNLGNSPSVGLEGVFKDSMSTEQFYLSTVSLLSKLNLRRSMYIFLDEFEFVYETPEKHTKDIQISESLVRVVRDLNEQFRKAGVKIYLICAIREELAKQVIGGDAAKIVEDKGTRIDWTAPAWSKTSPHSIHPLFEIILRRIYFSKIKRDVSFESGKQWDVVNEYFPFFDYKKTQRYILNLTTYRPRDLSVLMNCAKHVDKNRRNFREETFTQLIRQKLRDDLWTDFAEALRCSYTRDQLSVLKKVLFQLPRSFQFTQFNEVLDDFSHDPELADLIDSYSPRDWARLLKDLYRLGALGYSKKNDEDDDRLHFMFRGDLDGLVISPKHQLIKPWGLCVEKG